MVVDAIISKILCQTQRNKLDQKTDFTVNKNEINPNQEILHSKQHCSSN